MKVNSGQKVLSDAEDILTACQAVSKDMSSHMSGTCPSALLLLSPRSATPKAELKGDRNSKPQLALMGLWLHLQHFGSTMGQTTRGETPFGATSPSTTSRQLNIPNIFTDYTDHERHLELDAPLHTQKWMLLMQNIPVVYGAFETKSLLLM